MSALSSSTPRTTLFVCNITVYWPSYSNGVKQQQFVMSSEREGGYGKRRGRVYGMQQILEWNNLAENFRVYSTSISCNNNNHVGKGWYGNDTCIDGETGQSI